MHFSLKQIKVKVSKETLISCCFEREKFADDHQLQEDTMIDISMHDLSALWAAAKLQGGAEVNLKEIPSL